MGRRSTLAVLAVLVAGCGGSVSPAPPENHAPSKDLCHPLTCAEVAASCGSASDGCGGTLQCGDCVGGETCGNAYAPTACVPAPLSLRWSWQDASGDFDPELGADGAGDVLVVAKAFGPGGSTLEAHVTVVAPDGQERWSAPLDVYADTRLSVAATSSDDVRVAGGGKVLGFSPSGAQSWSQWGASVVDLAPLSGDGLVALLHRNSCSYERCGAGQIVEYDAGGNQRWVVTADPESDFRSLAAAPDGTVYTLDEHGNVEKLSADGGVVWVRPLPETFPANARLIGVRWDGNVVVASLDRLQVYSRDLAALLLEAPLPSNAVVALGPRGEAFIARDYPTEPDCFGLELRELGADGTELARRDVGTFSCDPNLAIDGPPKLSATISSSGDPILAGNFNVPVDFGGGTRTAKGNDLFVLDLATAVP